MQVPAPPTPPAPPELAPLAPGGDLAWIATLPPGVVVLLVGGTLAVAAIVLWPLVRALARRIEGGGGRARQEELEALRDRVTALEEGHGRLAELEERIDFAERMMARQDAARLPGSGHA